MKYAILIAVLMFATHAKATTLLSLPITTAIGITTTPPIQTKDWPPQSLTVHCNFVYGSGGETVDAYVQMSLDGGSKWGDVAECHFTTRRCVSCMTSRLCHPLCRRVSRPTARSYQTPQTVA